MKNSHIENFEKFDFLSNEKWLDYAKNIDKSMYYLANIYIYH